MSVPAYSRDTSCFDGYGKEPGPKISNTGRLMSDGTNGEPRITHETRSKNITVRLWKRIN